VLKTHVSHVTIYTLLTVCFIEVENIFNTFVYTVYASVWCCSIWSVSFFWSSLQTKTRQVWLSQWVLHQSQT